MKCDNLIALKSSWQPHTHIANINASFSFMALSNRCDGSNWSWLKARKQQLNFRWNFLWISLSLSIFPSSISQHEFVSRIDCVCVFVHAWIELSINTHDFFVSPLVCQSNQSDIEHLMWLKAFRNAFKNHTLLLSIKSHFSRIFSSSLSFFGQILLSLSHVAMIDGKSSYLRFIWFISFTKHCQQVMLWKIFIF